MESGLGAVAVGGKGPEALPVAVSDAAAADQARVDAAQTDEAQADEIEADEGESSVAADGIALTGNTVADVNASTAPEAVAAVGPEKTAPAHGDVEVVTVDSKRLAIAVDFEKVEPDGVEPDGVEPDVALRGLASDGAPAASDGASVSPPDLVHRKEGSTRRAACDAGLAESLDASVTDSVRKKAQEETSDLSSSESGTSSSDSDDGSDSDSSSSSNSSSDASTGAAELERVKRAVALAEAEANAGSSEPVRSKNEEDECKLEIPPVKFEVTAAHKLVPVGKIKSIMPKAVIVESLPGALCAPEQTRSPFAQKSDSVSEARALDAETVLVLSGPRVALGRVHETFGPVLSPFYIVRFNSNEEIAALGAVCAVGESVAFIAGLSHLVCAGDIRSKGYDASNLHDEELPGDRQDHSDDEAEAMAKRAKKRPQGGTRGSGLPPGSGSSFGAQDRPYKRGGGRHENRVPSSEQLSSPLPAPPRRTPNFRTSELPGRPRAELPRHRQAPASSGARQPIYHNGVPAPSIHPLLAQQQQRHSQFLPYQTPTPQGPPVVHCPGPEHQAFPSQLPPGAGNPAFRSQPATSQDQRAAQHAMPGHYPMPNFMPPPYTMHSSGLPGMTMPGIPAHHQQQQPQHFPQQGQPSMYQPTMPGIVGGVGAGMSGGMPPGIRGGIPMGIQGGLPPGMERSVPSALPPGMHLGVGGPGMHGPGIPMQQPGPMSQNVPGGPHAPPWHAVQAHLANGSGSCMVPIDQSRASTGSQQAQPPGESTNGNN